MNQNSNKNAAYAALGIAGAVAGLMAAVRIFTKRRNAGPKTQSVSRLSEAEKAVESYYYEIKSEIGDVKSQTRYSTNFGSLNYDVESVVKFFKRKYICSNEQRYPNGRLLSCSFIVSNFPARFIVVQGVNYGRTRYNVSPSNKVQVADGLKVFEYLHR